MKLIPFLAPGTALIAALAATSVCAGCPAPIAEVAKVRIQDCRFYDAARDEAFKRQVEGYYTLGWDDRPPERIHQLRREALERNTGAIVRGQAAGSVADEDFFYGSRDRSICTRFLPSHTYEFSITTTCPMVFFEAPTRRVITLPSGSPPG